MQVVLNVALLVVGFVLLMKGADFFVENASKIASKSGIPAIIIGLTIVAFGTSAPEAAISITAGVKGSASLAVSNVTGSNIMNVLLILGISSLITALNVQKNTLKYEIPFVIIISTMLLIFGITGNKISRIEGIIFWVCLILFFVYLFRLAKSGEAVADDVEELTEKDTYPRMIAWLLIGGVAIVVGSNLTVDSAKFIASMLGMDDRLIGLTVVAFGTSLPELITSITAARKHKADIAVGNIVGSNICNILFVLGTTAIITPIDYIRSNILDNVMAILVMVVLLLGAWKDKKLAKVEGTVMIVLFVIYYTYVILNAYKMIPALF